MKKPYARQLSIDMQNYLRQQAIRLRQQGKRAEAIGQYLGVHAGTVSKWWRQYKRARSKSSIRPAEVANWAQAEP